MKHPPSLSSHRHNRKRESGFTPMEIAIVMVIVSIIISIMAAVLPSLIQISEPIPLGAPRHGERLSEGVPTQSAGTREQKSKLIRRYKSEYRNSKFETNPKIQMLKSPNPTTSISIFNPGSDALRRNRYLWALRV
ncbi:MAG: hypothetical protein J7J91_04375, partial [Deltaproteobacteria bacterium]|nr:hypothetical protein [Deltaproteobacteria bacterium]